MRQIQRDEMLPETDAEKATELEPND